MHQGSRRSGALVRQTEAMGTTTASLLWRVALTLIVDLVHQITGTPSSDMSVYIPSPNESKPETFGK